MKFTVISRSMYRCKIRNGVSPSIQLGLQFHSKYSGRARSRDCHWQRCPTLYECFAGKQGLTQMRFEAFSRRAVTQRSDCLVIGAFERGELGPEAAAVDRSL